MPGMLDLLALSQFNQEALNALLWSVIFGVVGICLTIAGYKIFDWVTPIDVEKELADKQNMAVAIVCAAVIIGIAIVLHAAIG
jgi:putative membrane protein